MPLNLKNMSALFFHYHSQWHVHPRDSTGFPQPQILAMLPFEGPRSHCRGFDENPHLPRWTAVDTSIRIPGEVVEINKPARNPWIACGNPPAPIIFGELVVTIRSQRIFSMNGCGSEWRSLTAPHVESTPSAHRSQVGEVSPLPLNCHLIEKESLETLYAANRIKGF